jgi:hypothetical protein
MDRKDFMKALITSGICCCGAASSLAAQSLTERKPGGLGGEKPQRWIGDLEDRMVEGSESPAWLKAEKGERWIRDLMDIMDETLDTDTKHKLMQASGRACYIDAFGVAPKEKATSAEAEGFINYLRNSGCEVVRDGKKTTITYSWGRDHQNPWGLIMSDGYCMCPIVEKNTVKISPTFCQCSTGYVKELFERYTGRTAEVELMDSLKKGGNDCIFKIELSE